MSDKIKNINQKSDLSVEPGKTNQAELDELIKAVRQKVTPVICDRVVVFNNQVIDLEHVRYLEASNKAQGYWVILDCSVWNNDSDYWDRAPYIQSDKAEEFRQAWLAYLNENKSK